jgi:hypothetical protein
MPCLAAAACTFFALDLDLRLTLLCHFDMRPDGNDDFDSALLHVALCVVAICVLVLLP